MKGVRISMLYEYFSAQDIKLKEKIEFYENKPVSSLNSSDLHNLEYLKLKKEVYDKIFHDLCH